MTVDEAIENLKAAKKRGVKNIVLAYWEADQFDREDDDVWADAADRIELLEAALVVFAKRSEWYDEDEPDNLSDWDKEAKPRITIKDLRRARDALGNKNDR